MTQPLTAMERRVYEYLLDFTTENTFQPSIREIGKRFRIKSTKTVSDILQSLASKGFIERDASRSRGVRLLGFAGSNRVRPIPYYGRIHAGEPAVLPAFREGYFTFDRRFVPSETTFVLRVRGDSMVGAGIFDGDYVLVNPAHPAPEGEIVAARLGDAATVKRLLRDGATLILKSANASEPDFRVGPGEDFAVLGVVCGVFRALHDSGAEDASLAGSTAEGHEDGGVRDPGEQPIGRVQSAQLS